MQPSIQGTCAQQKGTISRCGNYRWDESFKVFFQECFSMLSLRRGKIAEGWRQFPGFPKCCRFGIHNDTSIWRPSFSSFAEIPYMSSCFLQCGGATKKTCQYVYCTIWKYWIPAHVLLVWMSIKKQSNFSLQITQMSYAFPSCLLGRFAERILHAVVSERKQRTVQVSPFEPPSCVDFRVNYKWIFMKPSEFGDVLNWKIQTGWIFWCSLQIWGLRPSFFFETLEVAMLLSTAPNGERLKNEFAQSQTLRTKKSQLESHDWCEWFFFSANNQNIWGTKPSAFWKQVVIHGRYVWMLRKIPKHSPMEVEIMWVFLKIGKHPKMDGENNGKPY